MGYIRKCFMDVRRSIIKTIWVTLISMMLITVVVGVVLVFVFTKQSADFMYDIGCDNIASILYYKSYEDSGDIVDCYKALNIKISLGENNKVVEYYEKFIVDEKFDEFMASNLSNSESLDISVLEKSAILNERNYLVNSYVKALNSISQEEKAREVALSEFILKDNLSFKTQGVYALGYYVDNESWQFFNTVHSGLDNKLIVEMQEYFNTLFELFNNNKLVEGNIDRSYLVCLGNRIIDVGQDVNAVYVALEMEEELSANNVSKMMMVNNVIKGII